MRKLTLVIIVIICNTIIYAQEIAEIKNVTIDSKELNQQREILIYTPQSYNELTLQTYDVIYVFDAQNRELFDLTHSIMTFLERGRMFIVVGITSPYNKELNYGRSNDFVPKPVNVKVNPKDYFGGNYGNTENFMKYIKNEVIPYVEKNYRTKNRRIVVGHSLGASFALYNFVKDPALFDDYIAISPNLAYDSEWLANELLNFDFTKLTTKKFLYISNADEGTTYWQNWKPAREKVYTFLKADSFPNLKYVIKSFPDYEHWKSFLPSLQAALTAYFPFLDEQEAKYSTEEKYEITISVKVPRIGDELYIVGNQPTLGDWQPEKVKMLRKSDFIREIKLQVFAPAFFKFTRGNWDTEAFIKYHDATNIYIDPAKQKNLEFEISGYVDK